ncbi:sulfotransferase family protein [Caulobacter sp. LARHSG274]
MSHPLDADSLMSAAQDSTGLIDWGGDVFREPLDVLSLDLIAHANLNALGVERARRRLVDNLKGRLLLAEDRKRFPAIADEAIVKPIFVAGLPRAGSTFFHNLLAADPANRSPRMWEIMFPSPPPLEETYTSDPRIEACRDALDFEGFLSPAMQGIHPYGPERPEECNFLWEMSLLTVNYPAWWNVPNYAKLLYSIDMKPVYEEQKRALQHLQHRFKRDRWVLKTPAHDWWMRDLVEVFPDAGVVLCHRDPAKVLASLSNNLAVNYGLFSNVTPAGSFGMLERQSQSMRRAAQVRNERPDQFFDAHYLEVQADPLRELARCYAQFGVSFTPERAAAVEAWMAADREAHARGPRHAYSMEAFDLDYASIDQVMGGYIRDFNVRLERAA